MIKRIKNLKISFKLYILVGVALIGMLIIGGISFYLMGRLNEKTDDISTSWLPSISTARDMSATLSNIRLNELGYLTAISDEVADSSLQYLEKEKEEMDKVFEEIKQYSQEKKKGKIERVPFDKNLANRYILKKAKCFQECIAKKERQMKKTNRLPNLPRIKVREIDRKNISRGTDLQERNKER